jgi:DNA-binding response OmpR family regulator
MDQCETRFPGQRAARGRARRQPHVLLAEDDEDLRGLIAQTLRQKAYQVTECADGPGLVFELAGNVLFGGPSTFDLVISDIRMPGSTALEILEAMRECEGMPPVILITAFPSSDTHADARRLGVAALFEKPFELQGLVGKAEELIAGLPRDAP